MCSCLREPNVQLGPMSLGTFSFLGATLDSAETSFARTPSSWLLMYHFREEKAYTTKTLLKTGNQIYHRNLSSVAPIFIDKEKFLTGAGQCMLSFSQRLSEFGVANVKITLLCICICYEIVIMPEIMFICYATPSKLQRTAVSASATKNNFRLRLHLL